MHTCARPSSRWYKNKYPHALHTLYTVLYIYTDNNNNNDNHNKLTSTISCVSIAMLRLYLGHLIGTRLSFLFNVLHIKYTLIRQATRQAAAVGTKQMIKGRKCEIKSDRRRNLVLGDKHRERNDCIGIASCRGFSMDSVWPVSSKRKSIACGRDIEWRKTTNNKNIV